MSYSSKKYAEMYTKDNAIATNITVQNQWEDVVTLSSTIADHLKGWTYNAGTLVCGSGSGGMYKIDSAFSIKSELANQDCEMAFFKNSESSPLPNLIFKRKLATVDTGSCSISGIAKFVATDILKLKVRNLTSGTSDFTVVHGNVNLTKIG